MTAQAERTGMLEKTTQKKTRQEKAVLEEAMQEGVLFDIDFFEPEIILYLLGPGGRMGRYTMPFAHTVYLAASARHAPALARMAVGCVEVIGWCERREFYSNRLLRVLACRVLHQASLAGFTRRVMRAFRGAEVYDSRLEPVQAFMFQHRLHPLCRVLFRSVGGQVLSLKALDDPWDPLFQVPPLKTLRLSLARSRLLPPEENALVVEPLLPEAKEAVVLELSQPARAIGQLNKLFQTEDPDVVFSRGGDEVIFPYLFEQAQRRNLPLALDRDPVAVRRRISRRGRSFMVYGQMEFKASAYPLFGRWHLDEDNSFFIREAGAEGLLELARIARMPVQRMARASAGTAMTAMEIEVAWGDGYLIPTHKTQVESVKSALELLQVDKGGLTYFPPPGFHERVLEVDFSQMYPTIMAHHNISPEVINCPCCKGLQPVPGTGYHTCTVRSGLIPRTIGRVLTKRTAYKALKKGTCGDGQMRYEARQSALKWLLVTTFGYQGYRNALFGLIDAHEAITAWGRESLLRAKELFEGQGFSLLHALTDSLYLLPPIPPALSSAPVGALPAGMRSAGAVPGDESWAESVEQICAEVQAQTGLDLLVEGIYDWVCFSRAKVGGRLAAATRYFGRFAHGEMKVRGLKVRRRDTPALIRAAQQEMLDVLSTCRSVAQLCAAHSRVAAVVGCYRQRLLENTVELDDLLLRTRVSKSREAYKGNSPARICLELLARHNMGRAPGQSLRYLIKNRASPDPFARYIPEPLLIRAMSGFQPTPSPKRAQKSAQKSLPGSPPYDVDAYLAMLQDAYDELIAGLPPHDATLASRTIQLSLF